MSSNFFSKLGQALDNALNPETFAGERELRSKVNEVRNARQEADAKVAAAKAKKAKEEAAIKQAAKLAKEVDAETEKIKEAFDVIDELAGEISSLKATKAKVVKASETIVAAKSKEAKELLNDIDNILKRL